ncbi:hypothetical protein PHYPSEUDO_000915 [Phytophthora pseudosyringae]|uniref:Uncharacterized protein n=1 Tax=Phytophthora pseudosyringae TaxID=221518 RepID=A0A8T1W1C5_9STRA|nr:hypothetical protein PHYPSEUDO_000915 [Phytophthora pseudosyringae]
MAVGNGNESLRRVEAFIAQLAAFKTEVERRQSQPQPAAGVATDAEHDSGFSGVDEDLDFSLEGPSDDAGTGMRNYPRGVGDRSCAGGAESDAVEARDSDDRVAFDHLLPIVDTIREHAPARKPANDPHAQHSLGDDATHCSTAGGESRGDLGSTANAAIDVDELDGTSTSSSSPITATNASSGLSLGAIAAPAHQPTPPSTACSSSESESDVEVCLAPSRTQTVLHTPPCCDCMTTIMPGQSVTLEFLQSLSDTGKKEALQSAMAWCSTKELRGFCGGMGVRVRSKEYAAYHTKAGYTELLSQLLRAKSASKGLVVGPAPSPIVVTPVERTRKTKNCNLRLLNVLCSDFMAPFLGGMNAEPTQEEVDAGAVGGNNPFWTRLRGEFMSSKPEYSRLAFQGVCLTGFNLSAPLPHSSTKLSEMWSELWEAYNSAITRFTHSTDPNLEFADCCPSRSDVYYMRCWLGAKQNLLSEICAPLPASIALNSDALACSMSANEGAEGVAAERVENTTPSRKRPRAATNRVTRVAALATTSDAPSKDAERAFLMQSIRHAAEILTMARGSDLGSEAEETVRCELQQCTKRLKRIQQEEKEIDEETEEE